MFFRPLIDELDPLKLAAELGLPAKNIRSWETSDSIPAEWFTAVERAARRQGRRDVTVKTLADIAERRRLAREQQAAQ